MYDCRDDAGTVAVNAPLAQDSRLRELVMNLIQAERKYAGAGGMGAAFGDRFEPAACGGGGGERDRQRPAWRR